MAFGITLLLQTPQKAVSKEVVERVLAVVNEQPILLSDLKHYRSQLQSSTVLLDTTLLSLTNPSELLKSQKTLLNHLINESLLEQEIKAKDFSVSRQDINGTLEQMAQSQGLSRSAMEQHLTSQGVSKKALRNYARTSLLRKMFFNRVIRPKIQISEKDVKRLSRGHKRNTIYTISQILIKPSVSEKETLKKAQDIYAKAKANTKDFKMLAKTLSDVPDFIDLGSFALKDVKKELQQIIKPLKKGDLSPLIRLSDGGFQIIKVEDKKIENLSQDKIKLTAKNELFQRAAVKMIQQWVEEKRKASFIKINL